MRSPSRKLPSLFALLALILALVAPMVPVGIPVASAQSSGCEVTSEADNTGIGTLRTALTLDCNVITFATDVNTITLLSVLPDISGTLEIRGRGLGGVTITRSDSADPFRIFNILEGSNVTLNGLTISNGYSASGEDEISGGGIRTMGMLSITDSVISGNASAINAGGIYVGQAGRMILSRSIVSGNTADIHAGGIGYSAEHGEELIITDSTISGNEAGRNHPNGNGGGISNLSVWDIPDLPLPRLSITGSSIVGNKTSHTGGGIFIGRGIFTLTASTVADNTAGAYGGGIRYGTTLNVTGSTIYNNTAAGERDSVFAGLSELRVFNVTTSIIDGACGSFSGGRITISGGYNFFSDTSCIPDPEVSDSVGVDPMLGDLTEEVHRDHPDLTTWIHLPLEGSPVINYAPEALCAGTDDQRGLPRPQGDGCDAGAVEVQLPTLWLPPDQDLVADQAAGKLFAFTVTATSQLGPLNVSCTLDPTIPTHGAITSFPAEVIFPVGATTVNCVTTNALNIGLDHEASKSFTVTVTKPAPPELEPQDDITAEATGPAGAVVSWPPPAAEDAYLQPLEVNCDPASGSTFAITTTDVTCWAIDDWEQRAEQQFTVTVADTTPPALDLPDPIHRTSPSPDGLEVEFTVTATDIVDGTIEPDCDWLSGDLFPLGTTTVDCTVEDSQGNESTGSFTITVMPEANLAPEFGTTPNTIIPTTNPSGTVVTFSPNVSSPIDDDPAVVCTPPSGWFFAIGTHTITCTVTDRFGLTATMSFQVTVVYDDGSTPTPPTPPIDPEEPEESEEPQEPEVPDTSAFDDVWARTDLPVANGDVNRTWVWGPRPFSTLQEVSTELWEDYAESPDGKRLVRYYDKARMEINQPDAAESDWYVTNGLLVVELITGMMQVGDDEFVERTPADVVIAGDLDDPDSPTYADLADLLGPVESQVGETITERLNGDGAVGNVEYAYFDEVTGHNIAAPFWAFMNSSGLVWVDGNLTEDLLFENPFYGTGRPITEAYWVTVDVGGTPHDVLLQCFERRCLTYTPDNDPGWQVEAGNVGLHYFIWRYGE